MTSFMNPNLLIEKPNTPNNEALTDYNDAKKLKTLNQSQGENSVVKEEDDDF